MKGGALGELQAIIQAADPTDETRAMEKLDGWICQHIRRANNKVVVGRLTARVFETVGPAHYKKLIDDAKSQLVRAFTADEACLHRLVHIEQTEDPVSGDIVLSTELMVIV